MCGAGAVCSAITYQSLSLQFFGTVPRDFCSAGSIPMRAWLALFLRRSPELLGLKVSKILMHQDRFRCINIFFGLNIFDHRICAGDGATSALYSLVGLLVFRQRSFSRTPCKLQYMCRWVSIGVVRGCRRHHGARACCVLGGRNAQVPTPNRADIRARPSHTPPRSFRDASCRGTSHIKNTPPVAPCSGPMPRDLW